MIPPCADERALIPPRTAPMTHRSNSVGGQRRQQYEGPLKAVIFDWAGTVVDYGSRAPVEAVVRVFEAFGVPVTIAEARGPMGMAKRDHIRSILALPRVGRQWRIVHTADPDDAAVERVYQAFLSTQTELLSQHTDLIPGCLEAIEQC